MVPRLTDQPWRFVPTTQAAAATPRTYNLRPLTKRDRSAFSATQTYLRQRFVEEADLPNRFGDAMNALFYDSAAKFVHSIEEGEQVIDGRDLPGYIDREADLDEVYEVVLAALGGELAQEGKASSEPSSIGPLSPSVPEGSDEQSGSSA